MALKNTDTSAEYPYVFMIEQSIYQSKMLTTGDQPKYSISLAWKYYKIDSEGNLIYAPETHTYFDDDFFNSMMVNIGQGDMAFYSALQSQQEAVKKIVESENAVTLEVL